MTDGRLELPLSINLIAGCCFGGHRGVFLGRPAFNTFRFEIFLDVEKLSQKILRFAARLGCYRISER